MIVQVAFTYTFKYIPKGKRNSAEVRIRDKCDVLIDEIGKDEAPLVLTMPNPDQRSVENRVDAEYRHYRDGLWRQRMFHTYSGETEKLATLEDVVACAAAGKEAYGIDRFWQVDDWRDKDAVASPAALQVREILLDGREQRINEIRRNALRSIAIDGVLFQSTPEPIVRIAHSRDYPHLEVSQLGVEPPEAEYYRVDRIPELEVLAEQVYGQRYGGGRQTWFRDHGVTVLRPDLLKFDDEANALGKAMESFATALPAKLRDGTKEFLAAYVDVRDAWKANRAGQIGIEQVADLVRTAATIMVQDDNGTDSAERALAAIERWDRTRGLDDSALIASAFGGAS